MAAGMPLLPSALPPKGEACHYGANNFLNLIALPEGGKQDVTQLTISLNLIALPVGADRAQAAGKTDEESGEVRGTYGESVSPLAKISHFVRNDDTESDVS